MISPGVDSWIRIVLSMPLRLAPEILARDLAKGLVIRRWIIIKHRVDAPLLA